MWFRQRWFRINLFGSGPGNFLKRQISNQDKCEGTSDSSARNLLRLWRFFSPYVSLCLHNPWPGWPSSLVHMGVFGLLWSTSGPWSSPVSGGPDQIQSQPSRILSQSFWVSGSPGVLSHGSKSASQLKSWILCWPWCMQCLSPPRMFQPLEQSGAFHYHKGVSPQAWAWGQRHALATEQAQDPPSRLPQSEAYSASQSTCAVSFLEIRAFFIKALCIFLSTAVIWNSGTNLNILTPGKIVTSLCLVCAESPWKPNNPNLVTRVQHYFHMHMWALMQQQERCPAQSCVHSGDEKSFFISGLTHRSERIMFECLSCLLLSFMLVATIWLGAWLSAKTLPQF